MIRLFVLALLIVAAAIAYPWVAAVLGVFVVLFLGLAWSSGRAKRAPRQIAEGPVKVDRRRLPSPDVLAARRWAWQQLHGIERAHGLPLTRRRDR